MQNNINLVYSLDELLAIQQTCIMKQKGAKDEAQKEAEKQDQGGEPVAKPSAA